jgi:hypothetical protein
MQGLRILFAWFDCLWRGERRFTASWIERFLFGTRGRFFTINFTSLHCNTVGFDWLNRPVFHNLFL